MQSAQKAIGGSSDTAQLSQSYYWNQLARGINNEDTRQYYENTVILAVEAQIAIDGCKRLYSVNVNDEIQRIRGQRCMKRDKDYPAFMKWTNEVPITKNGRERSVADIKKDKEKIKNRIDSEIICPMNWLEESLNKIQGASRRNVIETHKFLTDKPIGKPKATQMSKIRKIVEEYDGYAKHYMWAINNEELMLPLLEKIDETTDKISSMYLSQATVYRLIETSLGVEGGTRLDNIYKKATKYTRKMLNTHFFLLHLFPPSGM